ncbi:hypothetical protein MD484_g7854, partial [Candolleomyces efflorescens]
MLTQTFYSALLALGLSEFVPFGLSTPAVVSSPAGQVSSDAGSNSDAPCSSLMEVRDSNNQGPSGNAGWGGNGNSNGNVGFSVVTRCTVPGTAALTFDDGPWIYTNDIVGILAGANATGTFFYNGKNYGCIYDPDSVDRAKLVFNSGHQIASHTWSHADLSTLSWDQLNDEMWRINDALNKILGITPAFIRPPYGNYNDLALRAAAYRGQTVVTWDFDSQDSAGVSPDASKNLYSQLVEKHPDTILTLNHETSDTTVYVIFLRT